MNNILLGRCCSKIKVCHLTSVHLAEDTRIFHKECVSLAKEYEVHLIAKHEEDELLCGVYIHGVHINTGNRFMRMTKGVYMVLRKAIKIDADIYHFHDPELMPVGLYLKWQGKKVIYDVHEDVPLQIKTKYWIPKIIRSIVGSIFNFVEKFLCKFFTCVITATPEIELKFIRKNRCVVNINNYPFLKEFTDASVWDNKDLKRICYIGGITCTRGSLEMVQALQELDCRLAIGGEFSSHALEGKLKCLDAWNKVDYLGFLSRNEVKKVLLQSIAGLVVLHPTENYIESRPTKMYEYMASGIAVICSNFPGWRTLMEEEKCGLCVNPCSIQEISEAIQYVLNHLEETQLMGKNGQKAIEQKYNWSIEEKKLLAVYKEITEE